MTHKPSSPDIASAIADAIRAYCRGVSPAALQMSHNGVERIYYAGLSVAELAKAIATSLPTQCSAGTVQTYTEVCKNPTCPRGGKPVEIVGSAVEAMRDRNLSIDAAQPSPKAFDAWFDSNFLDPDGGSSHLPEWFRGDMRRAWDAAITSPDRGSK